MESAPGAQTVIDGQRYLYFGGTGYLGLAGRTEIVQAACSAARQYGIHTATSRIGFGNSPPLVDVEHRAAEFFGTDTALYLVTGYVSNHLLVQALGTSTDVVFVDEAAHYCLNEAALLAHRDIVRFRHRDPDSLAHRLQERLPEKGRPLVMTDGVFPVTGALAPLPDYLQVLAPYDGASLVVDDAHGIAVLGDRGRGTLEWYGLWGDQVNRTLPTGGVGLFAGGTLSKAMGGYGGIIPASVDLLRALNSTAHYYDGASAPATPVAAATAKAIEIVMAEPELRSRLSNNIRQVRQGLRGLGVEAGDEPSANIGVQIGSSANMKRIHERLKADAILVPYVPRYPGVGPEGLLRVAVCAAHNTDTIDTLIGALARIL